MHICNPDHASNFVTMTGIHVGQNNFTCGQDSGGGGGACGVLGSCTSDSQCNGGNTCRNACCVI